MFSRFSSMALLGASIWLYSPLVHSDVTAAGKAYSQGQAAQLAENYAEAAQHFELAYSLVPSATALRSAARSRLSAGHDASAATHAASLLEEYADDTDSFSFASKMLAELGPSLLRIEVVCSTPCTLSSKGQSVGLEKDTNQVFYARPGAALIEAWFEAGKGEGQTVEGEGGAVVSLEFSTPLIEREVAFLPAAVVASKKKEGETLTAQESEATSAGVHPAWFFVSSGLTLVGGAATVWWGIETKNLRKDYDEAPSRELYDKGQASQLRTNIAIGATAAFGVTSIVLAFATDWKKPAAEVGVGLFANGFGGNF